MCANLTHMNTPQSVTMRLPASLYEKLVARAAADGRPVSAYLRRLVERDVLPKHDIAAQVATLGADSLLPPTRRAAYGALLKAR